MVVILPIFKLLIIFLDDNIVVLYIKLYLEYYFRLFYIQKKKLNLFTSPTTNS